MGYREAVRMFESAAISENLKHGKSNRWLMLNLASHVSDVGITGRNINVNVAKVFDTDLVAYVDFIDPDHRMLVCATFRHGDMSSLVEWYSDEGVLEGDRQFVCGDTRPMGIWEVGMAVISCVRARFQSAGIDV